MDKAELKGSLSLLLQGPLGEDNVATVADCCVLWRTTFPDAQIVMAVSQSDDLNGAWQGSPQANGPLDGAALAAVLAACDEVIMAPPAPTLPPVKRSLKANHINLQVSAARTGLARITTRHVLRIRNDMAFENDAFLDQYLDGVSRTRTAHRLLTERVMISPYFTLNPLTVERLPFHFSDWLHLGLTSDVGKLWAAPEMTLADATWYERHPLRPDSSPAECGFLSRLAAEQHLIVGAMEALGRPVQLAFHNDPTDVARSLQLLADDFIIADFATAPVHFVKYQDLPRARDIDLVCMTRDDWARLVDAPEMPAAAVLADKIAAARALQEGRSGLSRYSIRRLWRYLTGVAR